MGVWGWDRYIEFIQGSNFGREYEVDIEKKVILWYKIFGGTKNG